MARTRFEVNDDRDKAFRALSSELLLLIVDYRGFIHPIAGVPMRDDVALEVENYLQGLIFTRRTGASQALKLTPFRYLVAEPFLGTLRSGTRFMRLSRALSRNLLTPNSSGFFSGVPFWGSCSALVISARELRVSIEGSEDETIKNILTASRRPEFGSTFYGSPIGTAVVDRDGFLATDAPSLRPRPVAVGSYPGSARLHVATELKANAEQRQLFATPSEATRAVGRPGARLAVDNWGSWCEVVPFDAEGDARSGQDAQPSGTDFGWLRDLEPLISELWRQVGGLPEAMSQEADRLHEELVELSDSVRALDRSRVRRVLSSILMIVISIGASMTATYLWEEYGEKLRSLLDRLG